MNVSFLKSRTKLDLAASRAAFNRLQSKPTDIAILKYLSTTLKTSSGGPFRPTDEDVLAGKYVLAILTSLPLQQTDVVFRELMYYRAVGDHNSYKTALAEYEKDFARNKNEDG